MSTKATIRILEATAEGPAVHLYEDTQEAAHAVSGDAAPVYLQLDGVQVELETTGKGACVTIALPRETARRLGLLTDGPMRSTPGGQTTS